MTTPFTGGTGGVISHVAGQIVSTSQTFHTVIHREEI